MIALLSITSQRNERLVGQSEHAWRNWWQRLWLGFVDWLMEPIDFPSKIF